MTFTIGRGNDLVCHAIPYFASALVGHSLSSLVGNFGATWRRLVSDSQIRWVGPEKGVTQLALGAVVNALWDLWAKILGKPVWLVVAEMEPEELVRCLSWRYCEDVLGASEGPDAGKEVLRLLREGAVGKDDRLKEAYAGTAVPAYTTSESCIASGLFTRTVLEACLEGILDSSEPVD